MQKAHFNYATHVEKQPTAHLRVRVYLYQQEPIVSHLISQFGLSVNVNQVVLEDQVFPRQIDLELHGTIAQVQQGLAYLASVSLAVQGKPNADGDSWHY
ncbi:MAG: NIL domain-containing protein [Elainella sp. C42_A2020_010]|nr:NIL domain-containing protein [Elainella sp. C42_A2020_010]